MIKSLAILGATLALFGSLSVPSEAQVRSGFRANVGGGRVSLNPQPIPPRTPNRFR